MSRYTRATALSLMSIAAACGAEDVGCKQDRGTICTVVGTGELGFNDDGRSAMETDLYLVSAARPGPDDTLHVMDFNNQRLRIVDDQNEVQTIVGNGFHALAMTETPATDSPLENPIDFRFLSDGRLIFTSYHDPRVLFIGEDGLVKALAGAGEVGLDGNEGDDGPALEALFIQLDGIALAPDDTVFVSDSLANRVRRIQNGQITTVAGTGQTEFSGDGGPATEASLYWPTALEFDEDGSLLIADTRNHVIRRLLTDGNIETVAGTGVKGASGDGGPATDAQLDQPNGLAFAPDGSLLIADRGNFKIRRVSLAGIIETVAGSGVKGYAGDGGDGLDADFGFVARIARDGDSLLIADQSNSVVRRWTFPSDLTTP